MTAEQFVYWLQGFMELAKPVELSPEEVKIIKDHLALVMEKKTPNYGAGGVWIGGSGTGNVPAVDISPYIKWGGSSGNIGVGSAGHSHTTNAAMMELLDSVKSIC